MILDYINNHRRLVYWVIVFCCGLFVPLIELLDPELGIIGILLSALIINGFLHNSQLTPSFLYVLGAAILVSLMNVLVLLIICADSSRGICHWNYIFFSFFHGGIVLLNFGLENFMSHFSKKNR